METFQNDIFEKYLKLIGYFCSLLYLKKKFASLIKFNYFIKNTVAKNYDDQYNSKYK